MNRLPHPPSILPSVALPLQVNQIGLYGGFISNYEEAVEVVRKCTHTDHRFRTLAEVQTSEEHPL